MKTVLPLCLGLLLASGSVQAQAVPATAAEGTPAPVQEASAPPGDPLRTLETIEALRPPVDWAPDPFARRPNHFDGRFGRPSPEEIALKQGGYLMYGISQALSKGGRWLNRVTGGPAQIEHARARDVPLDDEQIARAARWALPEAGD